MIDPQDLMQEARNLRDAARGSVPRRRTVVPRAYYGCYHLALRVAKGQGFRFDRDAGVGSRRQVTNYLARLSQFGGEFRDAIHDLTILRDRRVRADYLLHRTVTFDDASDALAIAQDISERLTDRQPPGG